MTSSLAIILVLVGYWIRSRIEEVPVFHETAARKDRVTGPLGTVVKGQWLLVTLTSLVFMGNNAGAARTERPRALGSFRFIDGQQPAMGAGVFASATAKPWSRPPARPPRQPDRRLAAQAGEGGPASSLNRI